MSKIDDDFYLQYEYYTFINIINKEIDISNVTYEQLMERNDELNYYKNLSNSTPYSIYYNTNTKRIQFDDNNELFRGSIISYSINRNVKVIIGPSGEYFNFISINTLSFNELLKFAKLEIELNRNPFYIDISVNNAYGYGNGINSGSLSQIMIYYCKLYIDYFHNDLMNRLENEESIEPKTSLHIIYDEFMANFDLTYGNIDLLINYLNIYFIDDKKRRIFTIHYLLKYTSFMEITIIIYELLSYIGLLNIYKKTDENANEKQIEFFILETLDDMAVDTIDIIKTADWSIIDKDFLSLNSEDLIDYLLDNNTTINILDKLTILINEFDIDYKNKEYYSYPYNLSTIKKKKLAVKLTLDIDYIINNRFIDNEFILNTNHIQKLQSFIIDFSFNEIILKKYIKNT